MEREESNRPISEVKSETALSYYRENLEIVINHSSDNFVLLDVHANLILFNDGFRKFAEKMAGITPEPGMRLYDVTPASRRSDNEEIFARVVEGETVQSIGEVQADDGPHYFDIRYRPVFFDNDVRYVTISALDITEQKRLELISRQRAEILDIILNNTTDSFVLSDTSGRLVFFNQAYADHIQQALGFSPAVGMHFTDVVLPARKAAAESMYARATGGESIDSIVEIPTPSGVRFYELHIQPILKDGRVTHISRSATDITEKRNQEMILEEYRKNLEIVFENTNDHIVLIDESGKVISFNARFACFIEQTLQITPAAGMSFQEFIPPHRKEIARSLFARALKGETTFSESELVTGSHRVYFELRYVPVFRDGRVTHVSFRAIDRTQWREQEIEINEYRQNLSILFENSSDCFLLLDSSDTVIFFNHRFSEFTRNFLGVDARKGMRFMEVVAADRQAIAQTLFDRALNGVSSSVEAEFASASGPFWVNIRYFPVIQNGKITHVCSVATDISERKQHEIEINEYRLSLENKVLERTAKLNAALEKEHELVEMKSKFVSMASHEFRTPLATISLAAEFVRKYGDRIPPETVDRKLEIVEKQVDHMTTLLNNVLAIGKSDAGKMEIKWSTFDVRGLFEKLVLDVESSTRSIQKVNLTFDGQPETFRSDEELIRTIFFNLLTNAIKFSGNSQTVFVHVTCGEKLLNLIVRDCGMGIPPEDIPKLFEPFFRAGNATNIGGTGLGLSIVKKAVDVLKGKLSVESELGKGTAFYVTLPRL